jgi:pilus assembly protein CpaF
MLQAMNTGHEGSMTTVHANSPRDALGRLENMVSMAGINYPVRAIREQISSALNVLVHVDRITGGARRIVKIVELTGTEGEVICLHDIFRFVQQGIDSAGNARGYFETCGVRPNLVSKLLAEGVEMPPTLFERRVLAQTGGDDKEKVVGRT